MDELNFYTSTVRRSKKKVNWWSKPINIYVINCGELVLCAGYNQDTVFIGINAAELIYFAGDTAAALIRVRRLLLWGCQQ